MKHENSVCKRLRKVGVNALQLPIMSNEWWRSAVINVAQSGYFSSDRTIQEYVDKIWHLKPLHEDK